MTNVAKFQNNPSKSQDVYQIAGVDTDEADKGLTSLAKRIRNTWPRVGKGKVQLPIGYFANIVEIGGNGIAICTDGVGSKAIIANLLNKYDTIGIDCVAMNVNDLICVGARPVSMVDYIAIERADAKILDQISIGLTEGAELARVSISGGEIAQIKDIINGFDLVGMAVGEVALDEIIDGSAIRPGNIVIGVASSGIHSNGVSLARHAFFERNSFGIDHKFSDLDCELGLELLRPTFIYVQEIMAALKEIASIKALTNITSDGFLNLSRSAAPVGFTIDQMPPTPPIFELIRYHAGVELTEMYQVYNMGIGFCLVVAEEDVDATLALLHQHGRDAFVIGRATDDSEKKVTLPQHNIVGKGKHFYQT